MTTAKSARIPKYRLHAPSGLGVVRLNGRDIYLGKHGTKESRQEYARIIQEWIANNRLPRYVRLASRREAKGKRAL